MHDLIREHARALASRLDPGDSRQETTGRLLDYYQHAAARAQALLARHPRLIQLGEARRLTGDYPGAARDLQEAVGIFRGVGDRLVLAEALTRLGAVLRVTGDYPGAVRDLQEALGISRRLGC